MPKLTEEDDWQGWVLMRVLLIKRAFDWNAALSELPTHTENPGRLREFSHFQQEKVMDEARRMKRARGKRWAGAHLIDWSALS